VEALVPAGYIVALPNTETSFFPNHGDFGRDLAFAVDSLLAEDGIGASPFFGRVAPAGAVIGHSMGGGATILSAQHSTNIKTIAPLAAAETNPSAIGAAATVNVPALVFAGSGDCVTPPGSNQLPMFNSMPSLCKRYVSLTDGSHCQFSQNAGLCDFGQGFSCPGRSYIAEAEQHRLTVALLLPWLDAHLRGNSAALADFDGVLAAESGRLTTLGGCP
jgi:pimeloyl-ACP methyl ester carboxylesterase